MTGRRRAAIAALALALVIALAGDAAATPRWGVVIDRGPLRVSAEAGLDRDARRVADRAERSLTRITADLPDLPRPAVIDVRIVRDSADLADAAPEGRGAPRWAAGVAYPDVGVVVLALGRGGQRFDVDKTLDHELAHLALGAAVPGAPRWLHEGFAWQHAEDLDAARIETLAGMAWFGSVIPIEELEYGFPAAEAPASRAYAESYDFVGYLAHRGRYADRDDDGNRYAFQDFLRELGHGKSMDEAARAAFGAGVALTVRDRGPGIAPDALPHLFDRYWQGRDRRGGAGLGLAIVRGIARAHGGDAQVRNHPDGGAEFAILLPADERATP